MKRTLRIILIVCVAPVLWLGCDALGLGQSGDPHDDRCDDGTQPVCMMEPPECAEDEILAYQDSCFVCVNPQTCEPFATGECSNDGECSPDQWCNPCGSSSCPGCTDCVPACRSHGCPTEAQATCRMVRPDCGESQVAVVQDGCWICVDRNTCQPARSTACDDGTEPTCEMVPPDCEDWEILSHQQSCFVCVNPNTCEPWGQAECTSDAECDETDFCDPCGTSSCPDCDDCVAACRPHGCPTESELLCYGVRPDCNGEGVAVIQDGCWVCVTWDSCSPVQRDETCDDGTEPLCDMIPPVCGDFEILAHQNSCYACVNPTTCVPWGQAGCSMDAQCSVERYCNPCASGSCPMCADCVAGCTPHGCPTESEPLCNAIRPECDEGETAVVQDGCWECVSLTTCQ